MNSCELTASITAVANAIACKHSNEELTLLAAVLVQLGDTLVTIATQRAICENMNKKQRTAGLFPAVSALNHIKFFFKPSYA